MNLTIAVPAISRQLEAVGAAALVGAQGVLTLVRTQAARVVPALVDVCHAKDTQHEREKAEGLRMAPAVMEGQGDWE